MNADRFANPGALLITCEHGGNRVPSPYARLFDGKRRVLTTHRAFDRGALRLARQFARRLEAPLVFSTITRLLVDLNRAATNPAVFSEFTARTDEPTQNALLDRYYRPYRLRVESMAAETIGRTGRVVHLSIHSFTPVYQGKVRDADVGLLYDPSRGPERRTCLAWQERLQHLRSDLKVRRNYPYRGTADGLTTDLRRRFRSRQYVGIELEVNQGWASRGGPAWRRLQHDLIAAFLAARD